MDASKESTDKGKVAVIGSGLIGRSWAMLFAAAEYNVCIFDIEPKQIDDALANIRVQLKDLEKQGLLRGKLSVEEQFNLIRGVNDLKECVTGAVYVQECVPEKLELKKSVWAEVDKYVGSDTIMASSTSSLPASTFTAELAHRDQCIVAHPTNPPFYAPLTEICPAPYTREDLAKKTYAMMEEIGQVPVMINKEVLGFVLNRLQYQLLNECWRLIEDDAIDVEDLDRVIKDGLGLRYAFVGPLETCHLNGQGFLDYCDRFGDMIYDVCKNFGPVPKLGGPTAEKIFNEVSKKVPLESLSERCRWRDARLAGLAKLKADLDNKS